MTLDEFAKLIEDNLREMQAKQTVIIEQAMKAGLDPEMCCGIMNTVLTKIEREVEQAKK